MSTPSNPPVAPDPSLSTPEAPCPPPRFSHPEKEGASRRIVILIAVICVAFASVWAFVLFNQKPPVASGSVTKVVAYPIHTELRQGGTLKEGVGGGVESEDQLFVFAEVTVQSTAKIPLFPFEQMGTLILDDGESKRVRALSPREVLQVFQTFPQLAPIRAAMPGPVLQRETTIKPYSSEHGLVVFALPLKKEDWDMRRPFEVAISFRWQPDLVIAEKPPELTR